MKLFAYFEEMYIKFLRLILIILVFISLIAALIIFIAGIYNYSGLGISKPKSVNQVGSRPELELENKNGILGISLEFNKENNILVIYSVNTGSPADIAGLEINDIITRIDGKAVKEGNWRNSLIGSPDTTVKLTIARGKEEPFDVTLTRVSQFYAKLPLTDAEELEVRRKQEEQRDKAEKIRLALEKDKQLFTSKKQSEFREQSEKLAKLSRTFLELKKRDDTIKIADLTNQIFRKLNDFRIEVLCSPFYNNKDTEEICDSPLYESYNSKSGKVLKFDVIDLSENSLAFFGKTIDYFEIQSTQLNNILSNEKIKNLYMENKINDPVIRALNFNHQKIQNSINDFYLKGKKIIASEGIKVDMSDYYSAKADAKDSGIKILAVSLGVFAAFISLMLLIVFYKIERHLKQVTEKKETI